jgi:2-polyprenyl-3-methyl-5-hydroxy-6-metoxy-1,4-benzoquinol methylase
MGFFSLAMARMVGPEGRVICVDLQTRMINSLERRAARAGLLDRIAPRVCSGSSLEIDDLAGQVDFVLAFHVVHEVPDVSGLMSEIHAALKPGEKLFLVEPKGHVSAAKYATTVMTAQEAGFTVVDHPELPRDRATLFAKA